MTKSHWTEFRGIQLATGWMPDSGVPIPELPATPGIYAEIYWPLLGVRIGETGNSIRAKIRHDVRWFQSMKDGTAPPVQLRRTLPIANAAKATGAVGFEFFVVSADPRLEDKHLRRECERFMFEWVRNAKGFVDWNRQRSWR